MQGSNSDSTATISKTLSRADVHQQWWTDYLTSDNDRYYDLAVARIIKQIDPPPGSLILDAGCGVGDFSIRLANHGLRVHAIDFSPSVLPETRRHVHKAGLDERIEVMRENMLALTFDDNSYDYVFCWGVLMHIHDIEIAVSELARVLKPGGTLILSEANVCSLEARAMYSIKSLLGIHKEKLVHTDVGREFWAQTKAGTLLTRQADLDGLVTMCARHRLELTRRMAGEFTEIYTRFSARLLRRAVHGFNRFWFSHVGRPGPAFSNLLFFTKLR